MASSNIKLFDENKGNMLSDSEFSISTQRLNGLQTGVASSQLQNKAMYQASLVAYAIAQVMMQNGKNANDTDAVSAFVANLSGTMLQKVYDIATTAEAQAGIATGKWMSPALVKAAIDTLAAKAQNILSDETKALYSLGSSAVPNDVFAEIAQQLSNIPAARIIVIGLSQTDTVTATNGSKTLNGEWKSMNKVVNENITPVMTSDTTPEGIASSSQYNGSDKPYKAFDGNGETAWFFRSTVGSWIQYEFAEKHDFNEVIITNCPTWRDRCVISNVTLSTENGTIGTFALNDGFSNSTTITFDGVNAKRLRVTVNAFYSSNTYSGFSEIQINGPVLHVTTGFIIDKIADFGIWTVTAADGVNTVTKDVLVDVITEYEIEMSLPE